MIAGVCVPCLLGAEYAARRWLVCAVCRRASVSGCWGRSMQHVAGSCVRCVAGRVFRVAGGGVCSTSLARVCGASQGECFGLLGINGAGKTTTFRMLTGDVGATGGDAHLAGHSVRAALHDARRKFGYCPQFDALIDQLTVRETMFLYARLRGIAEASIAASIDQLISAAMLHKHRAKQAGYLRYPSQGRLNQWAPCPALDLQLMGDH